MAEEKLCGMCHKEEATKTCNECDIPLCQSCAREVLLSDHALGYHIKGVTISPVRSGEKKIEVCDNCLEEIDY